MVDRVRLLTALRRMQPDSLDNYESLHTTNCRGTADDIKIMSNQLLKDPGALHRICMPMLSTPLHHAAARGHIGCVHFMLGKGSCPNVEDRTGCTPLEAAVSRGHDECIRALLSRGADPNYVAASNPGQSRTRCLSKACMDGKFSVVKMLLDAGAVVDDVPLLAPDYLLISPCSYAVTYGHPEILRLLLINGAVTDLGQLSNCSDRQTLIMKHFLPHLAIAHKKRNGFEATMLVLDTLRKFGTDFCRTDQYGQSPRQIINILKNSDRSDEFDDKIEQYLITCECPLSLKDSARLVLVRHLGSRYFDVVPGLRIPRSLAHHLNRI